MATDGLFVKLTWSSFEVGNDQHYSLDIQNFYMIRYVPGEWAYPELPNSMLYIYENLRAAKKAQRKHGFPDYAQRFIQQDYYEGPVWWWCEVKMPMRFDSGPFSMPPLMMADFWKDFRLLHISATRRLPLIYQRRFAEEGTMVCSALKLVSMITQTDLDKMR